MESSEMDGELDLVNEVGQSDVIHLAACFATKRPKT
jgi:hypothetical protein